MSEDDGGSSEVGLTQINNKKVYDKHHQLEKVTRRSNFVFTFLPKSHFRLNVAPWHIKLAWKVFRWKYKTRYLSSVLHHRKRQKQNCKTSLKVILCESAESHVNEKLFIHEFRRQRGLALWCWCDEREKQKKNLRERSF